MINEIESVTVNLVKLALDAANMRHQAIANNIANANSSGYAPLTVNFDEQLENLRTSLQSRQRIDPEKLHGIKPFIEEQQILLGGGTTKVMLDMEVAKLSQNVVHYQALLRGLSKSMSIVSVAINEGKR